MIELILATNNKNKLREIREILAEQEITVLSQAEADICIEPDENGMTFAENAEIKARAIFEAAKAKGFSGYVLADDSGLAVDALNGEPGIFSHRWAGEDATDAERIDKMLTVMADVPDGRRGAHFACAMCLIAPDGSAHCFEGRVCGEILREARGANGFGYDPVFGIKGRSFAEFSAEEKNAVSHRHNALMQVLAYFRSL